MRIFRAFLLSSALLGMVLTGAGSERVPFHIPGDDASQSATDLSALSPKPAGAAGFVRIEDGHFYTGNSRLKIWGVNTCFGGNFPAHGDAEKAAAHLAKLGVNGVRVHHHDSANAPRGIWGRIVNGERKLDTEMLERQDYFLDQLHRNGIYANLNLHVGRTFTEAEGFVTKDLPYAVRYSKYLIYYEPRMRELFKQFCRDYLTHTNAYRKLRRVDDPGIAMVEISNENSFSKLGSEIAAGLPQPYRGEFKRQWNGWLGKRYSSTAALKKAWNAQSEPLGASIAESSQWKNGLGSWRLHQSTEYPIKAVLGGLGPKPGVPAMRFDLQKAAPQVSQHELQFPNLSLEPSKTYTLSFWVRADKPRPVLVDVSNQGPGNWGDVGLAETIHAGADWTRVVKVFRSASTIPGKARICFKFGGNGTSFELAGVTLQEGGDYIVLPEGETLEQRNIDIPTKTWAEPARQDAIQFMADTETEFIEDITRFLKKDLGVRVPITASQITYHGAKIAADTCDYTDIHAYWQHPRFPGTPWDPANWTIANTPMEQAPDADSLLARAPWRLLDRPFTISEWNIPDPNDHAASVVPFAAMVAALQDWDGVFFFQYHTAEGDWSGDRIRSYFSFNGQPVKLALLTACANLYRRGDLKPLTNTAAGTLTELVPSTLGLEYRIGIDPKVKTSAKLTAASKRLSSPDGGVVWDATDKERAHVRVVTPESRAVWGLIGERSFDLSGVKLKVGKTQRDYAAIVFTSLDGKSLETANRILLAAVGSAENRGIIWNETRTSVGRNWGAAPTMVNPIPAEVRLPFKAEGVYALDGRGQRVKQLEIADKGGMCSFQIGEKGETLWYEISRE